MDMKHEKLKNLPKADVVMEIPVLREILASTDRKTALEAVRKAVEEMRRALLDGGDPDISAEAAAARACAILRAEDKPSLRTVINATGIILHTNLGRALLNRQAAEYAAEIACSYSTLEYDAEEGKRGSRHDHVNRLIARVTGAEDAIAVNNNAAATLLCLVSLAYRKEVVVSRGELVEIGGSFRVPEIMEQGGTVLKEVGTTNKTHFADYERAIGPDTAALLKVHPSNYRVIGFTEDVPAEQLAELAHSKGLPLIYDLGSGLLEDLSSYGLDEPTAQKALAAGADVILFSGDKLLGGPQAGIIAGKKEYIEKMKKHPLARVVRVDKMTLAALEQTLRIYRDPKEALKKIPVLEMVTKPASELKTTAQGFAAGLAEAGLQASVGIREDVSRVGGGSAPMLDLKTWCVWVKPQTMSVDELQERLRHWKMPIVTRISEGEVLFDLRTLTTGNLVLLRMALIDILSIGN
ncbi:MAG: L-seryl-tRNA(Sec) selenium transferase [Firmicutes bacterium]|nr:L-seryl-tRNA(Sec) selenium transferase [Bacillota bacterium]